MHELILYATPTGPLAQACAKYFSDVAPTTAQAYPPHVTLTGFFHRRDPAAAVDAASSIDAVPPRSVEVRGLICNDDWIGLEIGSVWLESVTASFAERTPPAVGEDDIRCKDWLHLSLAYGIADLAAHAARARAGIDPAAGVGWEVALWERLDGDRWTRLS